ncbi:MAG: MlaD family protein, partial [Planctomycetota bacterium]
MGTFGRTLIGLVTLAVMGAGGWYVLNILKTGDLSGENVRLILRFSDAHGVPVGGAVRHKGVHVGEVLNVDVSPDDSGVIMTVSIAERFQHTLRRSSRFWIVRPHFGGLTKGVTGLDTLIKDPYVEYSTPDLAAPMLSSGTVVFGLNLPPYSEDVELFSKESGRSANVEFRVKFSSAQGIREGAPVVYRDIQVGTVRDVDLSLDGRYVEVLVLLRGRYRETARTDSVFWVAKPNVEFGFTFVNIRDMSKILTGAALAYATPSNSTSTPLKDGDLIAGADKPPALEERLQGPLVPIEPEEGNLINNPALNRITLAGVSFSFIEEDLFSDTNLFFQGTGLLYAGPDGQACVLTARTLGDGTYSASDLFSDPDIA